MSFVVSRRTRVIREDVHRPHKRVVQVMQQTRVDLARKKRSITDAEKGNRTLPGIYT